MEPLVSVIVTAYNAEEFVERALDSVLRQTYPHIEILAVNDGSTDSTAAILDRYTLADVVDVTTRKMVRDGIPLPFSATREPAPARKTKTPKAHAAVTSPSEGVIHQLLGDYAI